MNTKKLIQILLVVAAFAISIFYYDQLPEEIASHWDENGDVNGYLPKAVGVFLIPVISVALILFLRHIPKLGPMNTNLKSFESQYNSIITIILAFTLYIHSIVIAWNLGFRFGMLQAISPGIGVLFIAVGFLLPYTKRNFFIGVRTPWTISNDNVWRKSNLLGSSLFKLSGIIAFAGIVFPELALWFILGPILLSVLILFTYSYFEYKKEMKKPKKKAARKTSKKSKSRKKKRKK